MKKRSMFLIILAVPICAWILFALIVRPSNTRDWAVDQAILPEVAVNGDVVSIKNIRNFTYRSVTDYTPAYYDADFNVNDLVGVWYVVEPFASGGPGAAHTFLSFEFTNDRFLGISIEIRKEKGEKFSPVKGLFRNYEIMYVIGDERDLIKLRANYRKDNVYLYPINASVAATKQVFLSMVERAQKLHDAPEFYNTLTNTCTTNIVSHVNGIVPGRIPWWSYKILLPDYSDQLAYDVGLITGTGTLADIRAAHQINDKAEKFADDENFSRLIRQ